MPESFLRALGSGHWALGTGAHAAGRALPLPPRCCMQEADFQEDEALYDDLNLPDTVDDDDVSDSDDEGAEEGENGGNKGERVGTKGWNEHIGREGLLHVKDRSVGD